MLCLFVNKCKLLQKHNFGIKNPGIFNTDPRIKKEICSLNATVQKLKSKKFSLEKIKDGSNDVRFCTGFENCGALISVFECLGCILGKAQIYMQ